MTKNTYKRKNVPFSYKHNVSLKDITVLVVIISILACIISAIIFRISEMSNNRNMDNYTVKTYVVTEGDTLWSIADEYNTRMDNREYISLIREYNADEDGKMLDCNLQVGDQIEVLVWNGK